MTARLPGGRCDSPYWRCALKANLARFTRGSLAAAVPLLAVFLMDLEASTRGIRWGLL